ncbi:hypothetical protein O9929_09790 [Vibrio lentus]|nr:hypothetical protein [Vibrio lentus]
MAPRGIVAAAVFFTTFHQLQEKQVLKGVYWFQPFVSWSSSFGFDFRS